MRLGDFHFIIEVFWSHGYHEIEFEVENRCSEEETLGSVSYHCDNSVANSRPVVVSIPEHIGEEWDRASLTCATLRQSPGFLIAEVGRIVESNITLD